MVNKKRGVKDVFIVLGVLLLFVFAMVSVISLKHIEQEGEYDYCVEWWGFDATLHRDNLLYTCFSLAASTFYCDYEINKATQILMIKPITNTTKDVEGTLTSITYGEPNYFNCTRWLKSK